MRRPQVPTATAAIRPTGGQHEDTWHPRRARSSGSPNWRSQHEDTWHRAQWPGWDCPPPPCWPAAGPWPLALGPGPGHPAAAGLDSAVRHSAAATRPAGRPGCPATPVPVPSRAATPVPVPSATAPSAVPARRRRHPGPSPLSHRPVRSAGRLAPPVPVPARPAPPPRSQSPQPPPRPRCRAPPQPPAAGAAVPVPSATASSAAPSGPAPRRSCAPSAVPPVPARPCRCRSRRPPARPFPRAPQRLLRPRPRGQPDSRSLPIETTARSGRSACSYGASGPAGRPPAGAT